MPYFKAEELHETPMLPGVSRRAVWLDDVMLTLFVFEPGSVVPEHRHPHEQITLVVRGAMEFTLAGETRILRAGDGVCIPSGIAHSVRVLDETAEAYDAWSPPREDYKSSAV